MNAEKLKQEIEAYGILIFLDGDNIRFRFPGKQIPDAAKLLLDDLKKCKAEMVVLLKPGITKGRKQSLEMIMAAIIAQALDEIANACRGKQFRSTDEIRQAEDKVTVIYKKIMNGEGKLQDFQSAVKLWRNLSLES